MDQTLTFSREIMWGIPTSLRYLMYLLFILAVIIFVRGLLSKINLVTNSQGWDGLKKLSPTNMQWGGFLKTLLLQGKVTRRKDVALFHGLIFFGFLILWIATDLVAIHYDTPFKVFQGTTYIVISFLADLAAIAILVGVGIAYYRRYIKKPDYLSSTKPAREKYMYAMLFNLVVVGLVIEGIRILGTGMPINERIWSPIGWGLASLFGTFGLSSESWALAYQVLWTIHVAATMFFIASIPYTKFFHLILAPFNALLTPPMRSAILSPMDFEDEEQETFGLGKLSELSVKNRLDLISCVECGRCTLACPAHGAGKDLNPKTIITKLRDFMEGVKDEDGEIWNESAPIYSANELDACTTCGACVEECPLSIEHINIVMEAKRYKVLTLGDIPAAAADATNKTKINNNPWGITHDDRFKWSEGMDLPKIKAGQEYDYLYFVGCAGSHDDANKKVVRDTLSLLQSAGVNFAVLGPEESCCGDPVRRFGDEYSFFEIAMNNIEKLNQYKFSKIITHCPHCMHTLGKEYSKFDNGKYEVIHHTELISELLDQNRITPKKEINEKVTFHDPCYLGRHHNQYSAPRKILDAVPGLTTVEMERSKDQSLCCGMGGGNMWYELPEGENLALNRIKDVESCGVNKVFTACSYCMININSSKEESLEVEDVASVLARSAL
ncbi:MAG: 4Fe-4S dicluster domain-containing protein [Bdellovibrionales bacterium]|jgi:Fe-S oxidoreductase/nitrate reductase gamma subunit|nr:4Fe-4S dicluster domain-containing protein [Bdellovibrionales bacterium]MBT3527132.1 4Fe-4S dicluster domain-containing protein [Bdellovibrionales bacterium]MBT7669413.1 4Fe-4S dicluster domain-containing protein [Bdellovibrionales bacterium]MBT7767064.1 4Fe-4S dicluster domain-containing protein [Bdellovibrionales bacterium]